MTIRPAMLDDLPALMDLATGWAMDLIYGYRPDHLWVERFMEHDIGTA